MLSLAERNLGRIGQHRGWSIALVGVVALVMSASLSLLIRMPQPGVLDEFSYLLAGRDAAAKLYIIRMRRRIKSKQ